MANEISEKTAETEPTEIEVRMDPYARTMFRHMEQTKEYVQCTTCMEVDMSAVAGLRKQQKYSYTTFIVHAVSRAIINSPYINSSYNPETKKIILKKNINLGVALDQHGKLMVPVIHNTDKLSLEEVDAAIRGFRQKAEAGKMTIADMDGATFTITNSGVFGSLLSAPVISYPQSAILGIAGINDRPVVRNGEIVIRPICILCLSYDHRIIEGSVALKFLATVRDFLHNMTLQ